MATVYFIMTAAPSTPENHGAVPSGPCIPVYWRRRKILRSSGNPAPESSRNSATKNFAANSPHCSEVEKKLKKGESEKARIEKDSETLLQSSQGSQLVCLDRTGRQMDSLELAAQVENWAMQGQKKITFIIGGPLGLSKETLTKADLVLSLSPMTFTHEMTRLLLLEQLYRACTIRAGEKYHK